MSNKGSKKKRPRGISRMKVCIVSAGASGLLLLLLINQYGFRSQDIAMVDPHFDGGALQRSWGSVISNTPWSTTLNSIQSILPSYKLPDWARTLPPDNPTPLYKISQLLRELSSGVLSQTKMIRGSVKEVVYNSDTSLWAIQIDSNGEKIYIHSSSILFTYGSAPKQFNLPIPSIPLEIALDSMRLRNYISPQDNVLVFGTNHSGTLIMKNLVDCSANSVIGIYKGSTPFLWARDGEYGGIKMDAAAIADSIVANIYPSVRLVSFSSVHDLIKETRQATWAIYSMGFSVSSGIRMVVNSSEIILSNYDSSTGKITGAPNAWGFGIAYPSIAPDGIHYDVGISSFLEHFNKQIPQIIGGL